jgi:hypothetical protein
MNTFQKPLSWDLVTRSVALCLGINDGSDGGKLKTNSDVVEETGGLLGVCSPLDSSGAEVSQLRGRQPKGIFGG